MAIHFHVGSDENGTGRLILLIILVHGEYVARITGVICLMRYLKMLAWRLAAELARPLASNAGLVSITNLSGVIKRGRTFIKLISRITDYMDEFTSEVVIVI